MTEDIIIDDERSNRKVYASEIEKFQSDALNHKITMNDVTEALKLRDKIHTQDISIYKESLETIEKIQYGKELDKWDSCNLQYTIEDLLRFIIENGHAKHIQPNDKNN